MSGVQNAVKFQMWIWMKYRIYWKEFMTRMESNIWIMIFHLKAFVPNVGRDTNKFKTFEKSEVENY